VVEILVLDQPHCSNAKGFQFGLASNLLQSLDPTKIFLFFTHPKQRGEKEKKQAREELKQSKNNGDESQKDGI